MADYTRNGQPDILWYRNSRGELSLWPMDGATLLNQTCLATVPETAYRIVGTGDYDGSGTADILWHDATLGDVWVWLMDGVVKLSEHYIGTVPDTGYQVVENK